MHRFLLSTLASAAAALTLSAAAVQAAPVTWQLSGWTFDDGGAATGGFDYDADTNVFSDVAVMFGGGSVTALDFTRPDPFQTPRADALSFASEDGAFGFGSFLANLASPLTNAGGTILTSNFSVFDPNTFGIANNVGTASLIATPPAAVVPLPAALPLLLAGLGALSLTRRRRRG